MKRHNYADLFRRLMERIRVEPSPSLPSDRRRLVAAVEQALRARARRRAVVRRSLGLTFGVAAALALAFGAGKLRPGRGHAGNAGRDGTERALTVLETGGGAQAAILVGADRRPLEAGMAVGAGLTLRAPASGEVRVGTADGTQLTLEARTELSVTEASATQRFALGTGAVRAHVSRLFAGERFIVDTADAEVEVHGTVFRVAVVASDESCGGGSTTRVSVSEGVVVVRVNGREVSVSAGGEWPAGCESAAARAEGSVHRVALRRPRPNGQQDAEAAAAPAAPASRPVAEPLASARPLPPPSSDLAAQNDLFAGAVRAKRAGRLADAARLFGELITAHPRGPLVESATVQRMKVLSAIDPVAGTRAAADYLTRFPNGFARPEAQELVSHPRP